MEISTVNTVIGVTLTFIGGIALFALGAIVTYVRSINRSMRDLLIMATEHKTEIEQIKDQIKDLYTKINQTILRV